MSDVNVGVVLLNTSQLFTHDLSSFVSRVLTFLSSRKKDTQPSVVNTKKILFFPVRNSNAKTPMLLHDNRYYYSKYPWPIPSSKINGSEFLFSPISEHIKASGTNVNSLRKETRIRPLTREYVRDFILLISSSNWSDMQKLSHLVQLDVLNSAEGEEEWAKNSCHCPLNTMIQYYLYVDLTFLLHAHTGREGVVRKAWYTGDFIEFQEWENKNYGGQMFIRYTYAESEKLKNQSKNITSCMESMLAVYNDNITTAHAWAAACSALMDLDRSMRQKEEIKAVIETITQVVKNKVDTQVDAVLAEYAEIRKAHKGMCSTAYPMQTAGL